MIDIYKFDRNLWQKLELRILMIGKQIYYHAKKNNLVYVRYLQHYLINCLENKILSTKKILLCFLCNSIHSRKIKFFLQTLNLSNLVLSLSNRTLKNCEINSFFINKIKESILYIAIQPVWSARLSLNFAMFITIYRLKELESYLRNKDSKFLPHTIVTQKLYSYGNFNSCVFNFLHNNQFLARDKKFNSVMNITQLLNIINYNLDSFYYLCNYLILNDFNWYTFNYIKKVKQVEKINFNLQIYSIKRLNLLIFRILTKRIIFRDQNHGYKIINKFNRSSNVISKIILLHKFLYISSVIPININFQQKYNLLINCCLNTWIKKHESNRFVLKIHINFLDQINDSFNKLIYVFNLISFSIT